MKKFNKNIIVFVFAMLFIATGIWGEKMKWAALDLAAGLKHGNIHSVVDYKNKAEEISNNGLSYHDAMVDLNSVKENIIGTRVKDKGETLVVKTDDGFLSENNEVKPISNNEINSYIDGVISVWKTAKENGAEYLYCVRPNKSSFGGFPSNELCYQKQNTDKKITALSDNNIPFIDFETSLQKYNLGKEEMFFDTDHHWRPYAGFLATKNLCEELHKRYGFEYNEDYIEISNYNVKTYKDWFLGSYGKKVGRFFSWNGADDFDLITPKFDTNLTEEIPAQASVRKGEFKDTALYMDNMKKDYYHINTYATYSGGDFRLQIMRNNMNPKGKKIVLLRDSFSCVVAPFLALQTSELHIIDDRDGDYPSGDKVNIEEYIKKIKPDYVVVIKQ